jgi:hypothetical protein
MIVSFNNPIIKNHDISQSGHGQLIDIFRITMIIFFYASGGVYSGERGHSLLLVSPASYPAQEAASGMRQFYLAYSIPEFLGQSVPEKKRAESADESYLAA